MSVAPGKQIQYMDSWTVTQTQLSQSTVGRYPDKYIIAKTKLSARGIGSVDPRIVQLLLPAASHGRSLHSTAAHLRAAILREVTVLTAVVALWTKAGRWALARDVTNLATVVALGRAGLAAGLLLLLIALFAGFARFVRLGLGASDAPGSAVLAFSPLVLSKAIFGLGDTALGALQGGGFGVALVLRVGVQPRIVQERDERLERGVALLAEKLLSFVVG